MSGTMAMFVIAGHESRVSRKATAREGKLLLVDRGPRVIESSPCS
jgi:hypothetical protein